MGRLKLLSYSLSHCWPGCPPCPATLPQLPSSSLPWDLSRALQCLPPGSWLERLNLVEPSPSWKTAPGCWAVGHCWHTVPTHPCVPEQPERGSPSPELLGTLLLLYGGRLEKQKGMCPCPGGSGRAVPALAHSQGSPLCARLAASRSLSRKVSMNTNSSSGLTGEM